MLARRDHTFWSREGPRAQKVCPLPARRAAVAAILGVLRTWACFALTAFPFAVMLATTFLISRGVHCVSAGQISSAQKNETAVAVELAGGPNADGFPANTEWQKAPPIRFDQDWQGQNADRQRETEVRLLWTQNALFLRFLARYRDITVFADAEPNGRRDHLWDRDVAEVFLQPPGSETRHYKEFEVSPNGFWIDLDITSGKNRDLQSGLKRRVEIDEQAKIWRGELVLPMASLTPRFDAAAVWRVNFYRVEGPEEPRFYSAWRPTRTRVPNFHVPEAFGELLFKR